MVRVHAVHLANAAEMPNNRQPLDQANQHEVIDIPKLTATILHCIQKKTQIDEIQNGGRRHLEFIIFVHFGQMIYFW